MASDDYDDYYLFGHYLGINKSADETPKSGIYLVKKDLTEEIVKKIIVDAWEKTLIDKKEEIKIGEGKCGMEEQTISVVHVEKGKGFLSPDNVEEIIKISFELAEYKELNVLFLWWILCQIGASSSF